VLPTAVMLERAVMQHNLLSASKTHNIHPGEEEFVDEQILVRVWGVCRAYGFGRGKGGPMAPKMRTDL
jgi:hypothetical protein